MRLQLASDGISAKRSRGTMSTRFVYLIWQKTLFLTSLKPVNTQLHTHLTSHSLLVLHTPRTVLDLLIAVGHVVAISADLQRQDDPARKYTCSVLGGFNTFTLMASNLWYLVLAVDLAKAIRNPFKYDVCWKKSLSFTFNSLFLRHSGQPQPMVLWHTHVCGVRQSFLQLSLPHSVQRDLV